MTSAAVVLPAIRCMKVKTLLVALQIKCKVTEGDACEKKSICRNLFVHEITKIKNTVTFIVSKCMSYTLYIKLNLI